jgi:hypothetical protein
MIAFFTLPAQVIHGELYGLLRSHTQQLGHQTPVQACHTFVPHHLSDIHSFILSQCSSSHSLIFEIILSFILTEILFFCFSKLFSALHFLNQN